MKRCESCIYWINQMTEDNGHTHYLGFTLSSQGVRVDHGQCLREPVLLKSGRQAISKACEQFKVVSYTQEELKL